MLLLHILAGFIGLAIAPAAMATRKGGTWHRRWGWVYAASMALVGTTAILLALSPLNLFLLLVGVFSLYMTYSGVRSIRQRRSRAIHPADWVIAGFVVICCAILVLYGMARLIGGDAFGLVPTALGGVGGSLAGLDLAFYRRPDFSPSSMYLRHLRLMIGSYIAMVSAFSATNLLFLPPVIRWLWPTLIGSILIAVWSRRVAKRFGTHKKVASTLAILSFRRADESPGRGASHDRKR